MRRGFLTAAPVAGSVPPLPVIFAPCQRLRSLACDLFGDRHSLCPCVIHTDDGAGGERAAGNSAKGPTSSTLDKIGPDVGPDAVKGAQGFRSGARAPTCIHDSVRSAHQLTALHASDR